MDNKKQIPSNAKTLPKKIKIGYSNYTIVQQSELVHGRGKKKEELMGLCESQQGRIQICSNQGKQEFANTVLHEVMHAICWSQGLKLNDKVEEAVVTQLTNGLCTLFKDNPEFMLWLKKSLK
jgi:hypothetical protein